MDGRRDGGPGSVRRRYGGARIRREGEGRAERGDGDHAECDPCREPVENRRALLQPDVAPAHASHDGSEQLRAAGGPGDPCRHDKEAQCIARQRAPGMPEPTGQRIADDHDEHGRHGGEREQGGGGGPDDVEDPLQPSGPEVATHRLG